MKILNLVYRQIKIFDTIGMSSYLKWRLPTFGPEITVTIDSKPVVVRKGTRDLSIAISSLTGEYELLRHLLPKDFSGIILDAGGYIGTSAMAFHGLYPHATVVVVEPSIENLNILKKNVENLANVRIVHGALVGGDVKSISLKDRGTECGFTIVHNPKDKTNASVMHETPAFRLRDLLAPNQEIGLLKLDIEGGEADIMESDLEELKKIPVIFAELHDNIVEGCTGLFFGLSTDRLIIKSDGEKYLSVKKSH